MLILGASFVVHVLVVVVTYTHTDFFLIFYSVLFLFWAIKKLNIIIMKLKKGWQSSVLNPWFLVDRINVKARKNSDNNDQLNRFYFLINHLCHFY